MALLSIQQIMGRGMARLHWETWVWSASGRRIIRRWGTLFVAGKWVPTSWVKRPKHDTSMVSMLTEERRGLCLRPSRPVRAVPAPRPTFSAFGSYRLSRCPSSEWFAALVALADVSPCPCSADTRSVFGCCRCCLFQVVICAGGLCPLRMQYAGDAAPCASYFLPCWEASLWAGE